MVAERDAFCLWGLISITTGDCRTDGSDAFSWGEEGGTPVWNGRTFDFTLGKVPTNCSLVLGVVRNFLGC
jgi:hypothetical protein